MDEIFVLAEHRQGQLRDITFEILAKGKELSEIVDADLTAVLLGNDVQEYARILSTYADRVLVVEDSKLANYTSQLYHRIVSDLIEKYRPVLTMLGHTALGIDLAPGLATSLNVPLVTDCIDVNLEKDRLIITRQMYNGKVNIRGKVKESERYLITLRQGTFPIQEPSKKGEIINVQVAISDGTGTRFIEYVSPSLGEVDITATDVLVGVGRGIQDLKNMVLVEELAQILRGAIACSRPIVDKGWLLNDRQVGTSGKTVKPKLYLAVGISGAFQHILGMKSSELIIAINKDPNAPIFQYADYGIVNDLFKILPSLNNRLRDVKKTSK